MFSKRWHFDPVLTASSGLQIINILLQGTGQGKYGEVCSNTAGLRQDKIWVALLGGFSLEQG